jgi:hypothetical protein
MQRRYQLNYLPDRARWPSQNQSPVETNKPNQSMLLQVLDIYNSVNDDPVDVGNISEERLEDVIISFNTLQITYDFRNSKVLNIEL